MNAVHLKAWLDQFLSAHSPGTQLPFARELSEKSGLSESTVNRVLALLVKQGSIERIRGKGTFVAEMPGQSRPAIDLRPRASSEQLVIESIVEAISRGDLKSGNVLPPLKVMCAQMRSGATTIRLALRKLHAGGLIRRVGRYYRIGDFAPDTRLSSRRRVILLAPSVDDIDALFTNVATKAAYIRMLEELADAGFVLESHLFGEIAALVSAWHSSGEHPQGILIAGSHEAGLTANELREVWRALEESLHRWRVRPRVVGLLRGRGANIPGLLIYNIGHHVVAVARAVARYVMVNGYRRVRCFFPEDTVALSEFINIVNLLLAISALAPRVPVDFIVHGHKSESREVFLDKFNKRFNRGYLASVLSKHAPIPLERLEQSISAGKLLADSLGTCGKGEIWVFTDDRSAAVALDLCAAKGVVVPRDVSLLTLENSPAFYHRNLSACEPDYRTAGYLMAHSFIGLLKIAKTTHGYIPMQARIIERATTGHQRGYNEFESLPDAILPK